MTRTRSSIFQGVNVVDTYPDEPTRREPLLATAQDYHLLYDVVTGENGIAAASVINHSGAGRGCPLGLPLGQQYVGQDLYMPDTDLSTYGGGNILLCFPVIVPTDEDYVYIFEMEFERDSSVLVFDSTGTPTSSTSLPSGRRRCAIEFDDVGFHVVVVESPLLPSSTLLGAWSLHKERYRSASSAGWAYPEAAIAGNPIPITAATVIDTQALHDEFFQVQGSISGWMLTRMSRVLNALWESMTGAPPPGNSSLQQADSGATNPATSRFWAGTRASWAAEGQAQFPVFAEALGGFRAAAGHSAIGSKWPTDSTFTSGTPSWAPLTPLDASGTWRTACVMPLQMPDFPAAAGTSTLKVEVIALGTKGTPTAWSARVATVTGTSAGVAFTRIGATNLYRATITAVVFNADLPDVMALQVSRTAGAYLFEEFGLVGWCACFDP